jgi:hypothetical protein
MNWKKDKFNDEERVLITEPLSLNEKCAVLSNVVTKATELGYGPADKENFICMILGEADAREAREENRRLCRAEI